MNTPESGLSAKLIRDMLIATSDNLACCWPRKRGGLVGPLGMGLIDMARGQHDLPVSGPRIFLFRKICQGPSASRRPGWPTPPGNRARGGGEGVWGGCLVVDRSTRGQVGCMSISLWLEKKACTQNGTLGKWNQRLKPTYP